MLSYFSLGKSQCAVNFSITVSDSFPFEANFPSLSLLQQHTVFHLHSCCEAIPSASLTDLPAISLQQTLCRFVPCRSWILMQQSLHERNTGAEKITLLHAFLISKWLRGKLVFWYSWACSCGSPSTPPSWLYEREVNPDSYWITGFSVHTGFFYHTIVWFRWPVSLVKGLHRSMLMFGWVEGEIEKSSTHVERLDCSECLCHPGSSVPFFFKSP